MCWRGCGGSRRSGLAPPYFNDPFYIEALAESTDAALAKLPFTPEMILASFHGMPKEYVSQGRSLSRHSARKPPGFWASA